MRVYVTLVRSNTVHRDPAAVRVGEHDRGDAVVSQASPAVTVPAVLRLGHHGAHGSQEAAVPVPEGGLLHGVTVHVHTVRWVNLAEVGETNTPRNKRKLETRAVRYVSERENTQELTAFVCQSDLIQK